MCTHHHQWVRGKSDFSPEPRCGENTTGLDAGQRALWLSPSRSPLLGGALLLSRVPPLLLPEESMMDGDIRNKNNAYCVWLKMVCVLLKIMNKIIYWLNRAVWGICKQECKWQWGHLLRLGGKKLSGPWNGLFWLTARKVRGKTSLWTKDQKLPPVHWLSASEESSVFRKSLPVERVCFEACTDNLVVIFWPDEKGKSWGIKSSRTGRECFNKKNPIHCPWPGPNAVSYHLTRLWLMVVSAGPQHRGNESLATLDGYGVCRKLNIPFRSISFS